MGKVDSRVAKGRGRIHLVGIGGVGMSALAQALLDVGYAVSGSDRFLDSGDTTDTLERLRTQGVAMYPQNGEGVAGAGRLVVSTAIESDNADLVAATRHGIEVIHRADQLAELAQGHRLIAITGTSGKSSVAAMLGWLLQEAGLDPAVVNGAGVVGWGERGRIASVRKGAGEWMVIEADESDRSLMAFKPEHAIITNAGADHFGEEETLELFDRFRGNVSGVIIDGVAEAVVAEGTAVPAPEAAVTSGWGSSFVFRGVKFSLALPGMHNILNAWQAVRLAAEIGVPLTKLAAGLATFGGIERRLQRVGELCGAVVIDDYAHNPDKIAAAWSTLAAVFERVVLVWRPHGYGPLRKMLDGFEAAFVKVMRSHDLLILLPVYDMGGTADRSVNSAALVSRLTARGLPVCAVRNIDQAEEVLRRAAAPGVALVTCGARDPGLPRLAKRLVESFDILH